MVDQHTSPAWPYPSAKTLLPPNASEFEQHIEQALLLREDTLQAIDALRGVKFDPPDELLPWLIWEYGLTGIVPYLNDLRLAIREGLLWQKERGTEAAVRRALSWIAIVPDAFEHETPGVHWNEFQIDTGRVPNREERDSLIALAALSSPARSQLRRLYHGCDRRRFRLDHSEWGDLLDDYGGVRLPEYGGLLAMAFCHHDHQQVHHTHALTDHSLWLKVDAPAQAWRALRLDNDPIFGETAVPNHPALLKFTFSAQGDYKPPQYWPDVTWPETHWDDTRLTAGMQVTWQASARVQAEPATSSALQSFLYHDQTIHLDRQADSSVTWQAGAEAQPYLPTWHDTGWSQHGWQHDILIESDYP